MPRVARVVALDYPHHITQRGNYKQKIFTVNSDYLQYLKWLNEYSHKYRLAILAYCLMPNHVHFVAIPKREDSFARTFNTCHMCYAQFFNKRNNLNGHLWQGRFYSCVLDELHLYSTIRYVETNPVRAKIVKKAVDWKWSSARGHLNKKKDRLALVSIKDFIDIGNWGEYLEEANDEEVLRKIRKNTLSGRPLGGNGFVDKLEKILGRKLRSQRVGRPKRKK